MNTQKGSDYKLFTFNLISLGLKRSATPIIFILLVPNYTMKDFILMRCPHPSPGIQYSENLKFPTSMLDSGFVGELLNLRARDTDALAVVC